MAYSMLLPDQLQSLSSSVNSVNEASIVVLPSATWETQRRKRRQIPDIATWVQLFSTYMLILAQRYPNSLTDLIQYQLLLVKQARKFRYPSWLYYDTEFRKAAFAGRSLSWAAVHPQIYALAFTNQGLPTAWCPICTVDNGQHTYDCPNFGGQVKPFSKPFTSSWSTPPLKRPCFSTTNLTVSAALASNAGTLTDVLPVGPLAILCETVLTRELSTHALFCPNLALSWLTRLLPISVCSFISVPRLVLLLAAILLICAIHSTLACYITCVCAACSSHTLLHSFS